MYKNVLGNLALPTPYEKSSTNFWNEPHISAQMLKAHLDPSFEGASRNHAFIARSAIWIAKQVLPQQNPLLLDIGCGPGLYAAQFAMAGYTVTGIDFSKRSIDYAKKSAQEINLPIDYVYQNYLDMSYKSEFDFATFIYCDYGALSTKDRQRILAKIYAALKPGGKLLLDVFSMQKYAQFREYSAWQWCEQGGFWRSDPYLLLDARVKFTKNVTLDHTIVISENEVQPYYIWNTYFSAQSLQKECTAAGFHTIDVFSDVAGSPYKQDSETIAILLQKQ